LYTCEDIYPVAITPMNATWEENDTYQRFGVTLCYRFYTGLSAASSTSF